MPKTLHGVLPIVHTPFTADDRIDRATLKREIDWAFELGADGLGTGMVSEILRLTYEERIELTQLIAEYSAGRGAYIHIFVCTVYTVPCCASIYTYISRYRPILYNVHVSPRKE